MSRLLFDARSLAEHGGVSRVGQRVLRHLRQSRPNTEITTITTGYAARRDLFFPGLASHVQEKRGARNARFGDIHVPLPNKVWSLLAFLGLTSLDRAAGEQYDELILPNIGFIGTPKIPYTIVVHDLSFLIEPRWFSYRMRLWHRAVRAKRLIQRAKGIWCVSQTTANDVMRLLHIPAERITVLPPHVVKGERLHAYSESVAGDTPVPPYVLAFTGSQRKNAATAIAAVARVKQNPRFADLRLFLIGTQTARQHLHQPWLVTVPFLSDAQLQAYYKHAAAFLYPSWYEGFGLPLHEAATANIPCLASAYSALPETAPNQAILIPPEKPHLWATALERALLQKIH